MTATGGDMDGDVEQQDGEEYTRRDILAPAIYNVIAALGGYEGDTYKLGDECYGCLKDLKKFWRKDDTDDERTVARIFWEARLLPNELVPILLETAGKGSVTDKCAIACADIVTAMTWPIDLAEELKELDEEFDKGTDYTQLLQSHLHYKAALLGPGVIEALLGIMLPCLAKDKKERKERDVQIINVILHLFRNLAFIKDRPQNAYASSDQAEFSSLQSKLVKTFQKAYIFDLLVTISSNATDPFFNQWNTLVMEIFYLLFRSVAPSTLAIDQVKSSQNALSALLAAENKIKLENQRHASSRHSRFGTTIAISLNTKKRSDDVNMDTETDSTAAGTGSSQQRIVAHKQQAINEEAGVLMDGRKRKQAKKILKVDELGTQSNLDIEAKNILQGFGKTFIQVCFNTFLGSILKDIKSERPKITEKDHLRLLFVSKWFLEFFLAVREKQLSDAERSQGTSKQSPEVWGFDLVGEIIERSWIIWILKRMREAVEDKPKLWTELQAGIECLTQLLGLIDKMHNAGIGSISSDPDSNTTGQPNEDSELAEAATLLQQQLVYNGEVLDVAVDALRAYRTGVQSLRFLDASVRLGYSLLRMLEKWAKERGGGDVYVRRRKKKRAKRRGAVEGEDNEDQVDDEQDEQPDYQEITFTFEAFEMKFVHEEITRTLLIYLSRHEEFSSNEQMKRVVNLLHRQAVRAKAEGLFFKVSTLNLFRSILSKQASFPKEQPYKDLINLTTFILKKYFKAVQEDPLLIVESFFPKNRNRWKQHSSWEPEEPSGRRGRGTASDGDDDNYLNGIGGGGGKRPPEVQVKGGYSWSQQMGIAIACLVSKGETGLINWVKEILTMVIGQRERIIMQTDGEKRKATNGASDDEDENEEANVRRLQNVSREALAKFEDFHIPYVNDEQADAATKNPHLKLVFRLVKFLVVDDNAEELEWYVPAAVLPSDLNSSLVVIDQYLETPIDLDGKSATDLLSKKARRRRRRRRSPGSGSDANAHTDDEVPRRRKKRAEKERQQYKSAQFIEDSDAEYPMDGADAAFWEREKAQRARTEALAGATGGSGTMRSTGTKKRKKRRGRGLNEDETGDKDGGGEENAGSGIDEGGAAAATTSKKKRGRKRDRQGTPLASSPPNSSSDSDSDTDKNSDDALDETGPRSTSATTPPSASSSKVSKVKTQAKRKPQPKPRPRRKAPSQSAPPSEDEDGQQGLDDRNRVSSLKSGAIFSDEEGGEAGDNQTKAVPKTRRAVFLDSDDD